MRKWFGLFLFTALCLMFSVSHAETLPQDVAKAFSDSHWRGYKLAAFSGFIGNEKTGPQYAVLLKSGDHNVLCVVEKADAQSAFGIVLATDKAIYQGNLLPQLWMDNGGNALFYTYTVPVGNIQTETYSFLKTKGQWGPVKSELFSPEVSGFRDKTTIQPGRGTLTYQTQRIDNCGNEQSQPKAQSLPALPEDKYMLSQFDISTFPKTAEAAANAYQNLPYAGTLLYSKEQVITRGASPLLFEVWGTKQSEAGFDRIDVIRIKSGSQVRQEIPVSLLTGMLSSGGILFEDANFDGFMDILVARSAGAYNLYYDCWLWDAATRKYVESSAYSALEACPAFDSAKKQIHCFTKDGAAQYYEYDYQVDRAGQPQLIAMRDIRYDGPDKKTITLWQPVNGKMTIVKQWTE